MKVLKTPITQFENLEGYPFSPNYKTVGDGLEMHYLDEGNPEGEIVLLLHGEPSWSYLYRKMIPLFVESGYRTIVPDLIGFGKSDKLDDRNDYSYAGHLRWLTSLVEQLDLKNITLFCQDWGGLLGLRMVAQDPDRFSRVVASNTFLPSGERPMPQAFEMWKNFSQTVPVFKCGKTVQMATVSTLSDAVVAAYDAPYPDETYKEGARIFPALVPTQPDEEESINNREAWKVLLQWKKPFLTLFGDSDPITKGGDRVFQKLIPGTKDQPHEIIKDAGHFIQEDKGEEVAKKVIAFMKNS